MGVIIGIDGGVTGAIAFLYDDGRATVDDLPTLDIPGDGTVRRRVWGPELSKLLTERVKGHHPVWTYIEALATGGRDSSVQTIGSQYRTRGTIECTLEMRGLRVEEITPQRWKRMYGLAGGKENKGSSLEVARRLFPDLADTHLKRAKDQNRAEALLIANFAKKAVA
jgi:hypothetical protein